MASSTTKELNYLSSDRSISAELSYRRIKSWDHYQQIDRTGIEYLFRLKDSLFDEVPMRVYIPSNYNNHKPSPCIILLHGATGRSLFSDVTKDSLFNDDPFFKWLKTANYIVIRPVADREKMFSWASNRLNRGKAKYPHYTFKTLEKALSNIKMILNIDDDRVYAFGHSDGGDGAIGMSVYVPDAIASSVAYNSMMLCLFSPDYCIRNLKNRPVYAVHSDGDDLRPVEQTQVIIDSLKQAGYPVKFKVYSGYNHDDLHLEMDVPAVRSYLQVAIRRPYGSDRYWETNQAANFDGCDWLRITMTDMTMPTAPWYKPYHIAMFDKTNKTWSSSKNYYSGTAKCAAVSGVCRDNVFTLKTSGVKELCLLISPEMLRLNYPVTVIINNKQVFHDYVTPDKDFMVNRFIHTADRKAVWINQLRLMVQ